MHVKEAKSILGDNVGFAIGRKGGRASARKRS